MDEPKRITSWRRRDVLAGLGAAGALMSGAPRSAWAQTLVRSAAEQEALDIILADLENGGLAPGAATYLGYPDLELPGPATQTYSELAPPANGAQKLQRTPEQLRNELALRLIDSATDSEMNLPWPGDIVAPDYRHIAGMGSTAKFEVDHAALERVAARNAFAPVGDPVLFGLRGARLESASDGAILVSEETPSHLAPHCVIGVWRRSTKTVSAWQGSTVPSALHTIIQRRLKNAGHAAHMLPTGLHLLQVGAHRPTSGRPEPGAFLMKSRSAVLRAFGRSRGAESYTVSDNWEFEPAAGMTAIQAGELDQIPYRGMMYSSAGGATVPGIYDRSGAPAPTGDFAAFRKACDLYEQPPVTSDGYSTPEDGRSFFFMLLTGRDVRLAVEQPEDVPELRRMRIGSSGAAVRRLQERLKASVDGAFGLETQIALLTDQLEGEGWADGVLTPTYAKRWLRVDF